MQLAEYRETASEEENEKKLSNSYQAIFKLELANFKRAVGHSFYLEHHLEDPRVCTKCSLVLFIWNSA